MFVWVFIQNYTFLWAVKMTLIIIATVLIGLILLILAIRCDGLTLSVILGSYIFIVVSLFSLYNYKNLYNHKQKSHQKIVILYLNQDIPKILIKSNNTIIMNRAINISNLIIIKGDIISYQYLYRYIIKKENYE